MELASGTVETWDACNVVLNSRAEELSELAATDNQQLKEAIALLHQVAMRLSSGQSIEPSDFLYGQINDFMAQQATI